MISPIYKEWFVLSSLIVQNLAKGITYAFSAILTPAITSNDSDVFVTKEEASWITAAYSATIPLSFLIIPSMMQIIGRRLTNGILNLLVFIGSITIATAPNFTALVVGRAIHGMAGCTSYITLILISEFAHPKRRGTASVLNLIMLGIGSVLCLALSAKLTWRQIAWLQTTPSLIGLFSSFFWPESPSWLAYEGRYQDCEDAFQWLRGNDLDSKKELRELVQSQRVLKKIRGTSSTISRIGKAFKCREFWKIILIIIIGTVFIQASGMFYLQAYLIEILVRITGSKSQTLYFSTGLSSLKLLSAILSLLTVKILSRKMLLFSMGSLGIFLFSLTCLFDYLNKINILVVPLLPAVILLLYTFVVDLGVPVLLLLDAEIIPIQYKGIAPIFCGIFLGSLKTVMLKFTANMLDALDTYGTFLVYISIMVVSLFILYFILPETKDKTLQQIENHMLNLKMTDEEISAMEIMEMKTMFKHNT